MSATPAERLPINAYATVQNLPALDFPHEMLGCRGLDDPELAPHLQGFVGYVMNRGDGNMSARRYHLWRHIQRVGQQASFTIDSSDSHALAGMQEWAYRANAILFLPDGSVRDPALRILMAADGEADDEARLPYPPDALQRRARTLALLEQARPAPPAGMPPSLGVDEAALPAAAQVVQRAMALFCVAAHAEAILNGDSGFAAIMRARNPDGVAALSPLESEFLDATPDSPETASAQAETANNLVWRYEALRTLLWALSLVEMDPAEAASAAQPQALSHIALRLAEDAAFRQAACLRPADEILDALDIVWRQHWIVRQAGQQNIAPAGINGDIVMERHHALNWLTGFQNDAGTPWDDIDTPT